MSKKTGPCPLCLSWPNRGGHMAAAPRPLRGVLSPSPLHIYQPRTDRQTDRERERGQAAHLRFMSPSLTGTYPLAAVGKCVCLFGFACQVPQLVQRLPIHIPAQSPLEDGCRRTPSLLSPSRILEMIIFPLSLFFPSLPFTLCHFVPKKQMARQNPNEIRNEATSAYFYLRFFTFPCLFSLPVA